MNISDVVNAALFFHVFLGEVELTSRPAIDMVNTYWPWCEAYIKEMSNG